METEQRQEPSPTSEGPRPSLPRLQSHHQQGRNLAPEHKPEGVNSLNSPDLEAIESMSLTVNVDTTMGGTAPQAPLNGATAGISNGGGVASSSSVQQPKVQTAFIHKLYNMLEDTNIQHLITWSQTNESFVVSPTNEFSKVLSQYFKHTNISSFVRQLNMYGFHKVNDVFHNGSPDAALWEFKHGNGNFKRGDLMGLREIKRRASRHSLIHRDSFSGSKGGAASNPGTPGEQGVDSVEGRLLNLEHSLFDLGNRLARSEEQSAFLAHRCQTYAEGLAKCTQWTLDLSRFVESMCSRDAPIVREIQHMQDEIKRYTRMMEEPHDVLMRERQPVFAASVELAPLSPRQRPIEEEPRPAYLSTQSRGGPFRPPPPPHMHSLPSSSSRRYGSFSGGPPSPGSLRPHPPPPPQPPQPPLPPFPNLSRRHTSADIRQHGWKPEHSPFNPNNNGGGSHWPPSPGSSRLNDSTRDTLASYDFNKRPSSNYPTRPTSPLAEVPPHQSTGLSDTWSFANAKFTSRANGADPGPLTRRSSMVSSNVHALLNPSSSDGDRDDNEGLEDRKRKRLM